MDNTHIIPLIFGVVIKSGRATKQIKGLFLIKARRPFKQILDLQNGILVMLCFPVELFIKMLLYATSRLFCVYFTYTFLLLMM